MYVQDFDSGLIDVAVAGNTTLLTLSGIPFGGVLTLETINGDATNALDAFALLIRPHPAGAYTSYLSTWTEDPETLPFTTDALQTLAANTTAVSVVKLWGAEGIQITASANTGEASNCRVRGRIVAPSPS